MHSHTTCKQCLVLLLAALGGLASCTLEPEPEPESCTCVQNGWDFELIDPTGLHPQLQVQADGELRIVYRDEETLDARYAFLEPSAQDWQLETVHTGPHEFGYIAALATAQDGTPVVALQDEVPRDLAVATRQDGAWTVETVSSDGNTGWEADVAVDGDGTIHLAWATYVSETVDGGLMYAWRPSGGDWTIEDLDTPGWSPSIAVDSAGTVHIVAAYLQSNPSTLAYLHRAPGEEWELEQFDELRGLMADFSLDQGGGLHVSSSGPENTDYSYRAPDGTWTGQTLDIRSGMNTSIVAACDGTVHIAWALATTEVLLHGQLDSSESWSIAPVQSAGGTGLASLSLGPRGGVHLALSSSQLGGLAYGRPRCE